MARFRTIWHKISLFNIEKLIAFLPTTQLNILQIKKGIIFRMPESLFNPNPNKIIEVFDLFGEKHKRNLKNFKFRVSVYGALCNKGNILLQRHPRLESFGLPGGGVEIDETIKTALSREFKEETGLDVDIGNLISVTEDYFTYEGEDSHSVLITYEVKRKSGRIIRQGNHDDTGEVKFMNLDKLNRETVQHVFWPILKIIKSKTH